MPFLRYGIESVTVNKFNWRLKWQEKNNSFIERASVHECIALVAGAFSFGVFCKPLLEKVAK